MIELTRHFFAAGFEQILPFSIPLLALLIPIIVVLTKHQQKMAELYRDTKGNDNLNASLLNELQALRGEIGTLRDQVNRQEIAVDDMKSVSSKEVQARLGE